MLNRYKKIAVISLYQRLEVKETNVFLSNNCSKTRKALIILGFITLVALLFRALLCFLLFIKMSKATAVIDTRSTFDYCRSVLINCCEKTEQQSRATAITPYITTLHHFCCSAVVKSIIIIYIFYSVEVPVYK